MTMTRPSWRRTLLSGLGWTLLAAILAGLAWLSFALVLMVAVDG